MAHGIGVPSRNRAISRGPKQLLALRGDEHLVERVRRGDDSAFEVMYERHVPGLLSFCRHMLGSREEAEDAVQHTFASAHQALLRDERDIRLKPWLYSIARNRCLSMLRARREQPEQEIDPPGIDGLDAEVQRRSDLRQLVADLQDLPEQQRAALVLHELRDLSHAEVAKVLECRVANVKGLVFRARAGLSERRQGRETPCAAIREDLATARGGGLRRGTLRHHLRACPACSAYLEEVRSQRAALAAVLPVVPTAGLKSTVLAAAGIGGGTAAGGGAAGGGLLAALAPAGGATVAKVALVGVVVAGGGGFVGEAALDVDDPAKQPAPVVAPRAPADVPGEKTPSEASERPRPDTPRRARAKLRRAKLKQDRLELNRERVQARRKLARRPAGSRGRGRTVKQEARARRRAPRGLTRRPVIPPRPAVPPRVTPEPRVLPAPVPPQAREREARKPPAARPTD